jgi:general secretion pathway protein A
VASSLTFDQFYSFFGIRENPFHVSPDPRFYCSSPGHDTAFSELLYSIQTRKGMTVLTGEAGTGKTMLVNRLLDWLRERNLSSAYVFHSLLRPSDLFDFIARDFGIPCSSSDKGALIDALHKWLLKRHAASDTPVIIIDEAQALSSNTLDELRLLLNLETAGGKLLHIVLVGQPELDQKLQRHQLRQLRQRIMFRCRLPLLSWEQTGSYISARLCAAGARAADSNLFPRETIRVLHGYSRGIPRVINLLCEHALLAAYSEKHHSVSPADIHAAAAKFDLVHDPISTEDVFPMSTRMALFLSPDPPVAEESLRVESQQVEQQLSQQSTEIVSGFPVSAPVPMTTETILSLAPQSAGEPDAAPQPIGDPPPADVPPAPSEPPVPVSEPNPPMENIAAEVATPSMNRAMANSASDSAREASAPAKPVVETTPDRAVVSIPRKAVFGPKRMATAMEQQAEAPKPRAQTPVASIPNQVRASVPVSLPESVSSATDKVVAPEKAISSEQTTPPKQGHVEPEFASSASRLGPRVAQELSHRLTAVPSQAASAPKKQGAVAKPVRQITVQLAAASEQLAAASRQVAAASKQIAVASKQLALASKRIIPPNFGASIARYCRGVANSFVRDLRLWMKPSNGTSRAIAPPTVATDSPQAAPPESATRPNAVVSISKWLREPMAPALQAHGKPNSSRKARSRQANKQSPRSAQKS